MNHQQRQINWQEQDREPQTRVKLARVREAPEAEKLIMQNYFMLVHMKFIDELGWITYNDIAGECGCYAT